MRYPKLRELKEAVKSLVRRPYTALFPQQPHLPFKKFRGRPYFHEEDCIGCAACVQVCPTGALSFEDHIVPGSPAKRALKITLDLCIFCGNCQANCPTEKGIVLSQEFDLATTGNRQDLKQEIEKPFVLCECCAQPILPADQLRWVARKLGALVFTNTSLMLFYFRLQGLASKQDPTEAAKTTLLRTDRFRILCPSCRRKAVITS